MTARMFERRERPTVMDGRVVDFAPAFKESTGVSGSHYTPHGSFHLSVSRNALMVHRCELESEVELAAFESALASARVEFEVLKGGAR